MPPLRDGAPGAAPSFAAPGVTADTTRPPRVVAAAPAPGGLARGAGASWADAAGEPNLPIQVAIAFPSRGSRLAMTFECRPALGIV